MKQDQILPLCCVVLLVIAQAPGKAQQSTTTVPSPDPGGTNQQTVPPPTPYSELVERRTADTRIWESLSYELSPRGHLVAHHHKYDEMATGLHMLQNGSWVPASDQFSLTQNGAAAAGARHQVSLLGDVSALGAVTLTLPEGGDRKLVSNLLGLSYFDTATGRSVMIAEVKQSTGELQPSGNSILFSDAFDGVHADVLYQNAISGFEQLVILREQLPPPTDYQLSPDTTVLQVITEFINPPAPQVIPRSVSGDAEDFLDFGAMKMIRGCGFALGDAATKIRVTKQWLVLDQRQCLVEQVRFNSVASALQDLGLPSPGSAKLNLSPGSVVHRVADHRLLPPRHIASKSTPAIKIARSSPKTRGFALDYTIVSSQTNTVFQSDITYFLSSSSPVYLYGSTVFEGNAIIKYENGASLNILSGSPTPNVTWRVADYRPVVFTGKDDLTLGEAIDGATGSPTNYANPALYLEDLGAQTITHARFCYAKQAILIDGVNLTNYDCQFLSCLNGVCVQQDANSTVFLGNTLFSKTKTNLALCSSVTSTIAQNATFSTSALLASRSSGTPTVLLTNCILANVTNVGASVTVQGSYDGLYNTPVFSLTSPLTNTFNPFNVVGGAGYYLADGCAFKDVATTNLDPTLLANLHRKTVYPPIVYSNAQLYADLTLGPQAQRQTSTLSLGFAYEPLDYAFGGCDVYANITFLPGTAVGWFRTTSGWYHAGQGIHLDDRKIATFNGTATAPCYWARANVVQEEGTGYWDGGYGPGGITGWADQYAQDITLSPEVHLLFTRCSMFPDESGFFRDDNGYIIVRGTHCEFWSGGYGAYGNSGYFTNCLWDRSGGGNAEGWAGNAWSLQNCTFYGGVINFVPWYVTPLPLSISNCVFDSTTISVNTNTTADSFDYNAFQASGNHLPAGDAHYYDVTNFNWQTSWLGGFYLPTNSPVIDHGSTNANLLGFYQFTTRVSQAKETNSIVDYGYHYVACDAYGNPIDTDGDGIPDYLEDTGNGLVDSGETNWQDASDLGLKVVITRPRSNSAIP